MTAAQKAIVKALTVVNPSATPCVYADRFGIDVYASRTRTNEGFQCPAAINQVGLPGDTITITPSAAVNVLGASLEQPAS